MNLANYYKGEAPPPTKKKNKILLFTKKIFLFCVFKIIDFIFWIRKIIEKIFTYLLGLILTVYGIILMVLYFVFYFSYRNKKDLDSNILFIHYNNLLKNKFISKWLKK
jgi:hypothetical protein